MPCVDPLVAGPAPDSHFRFAVVDHGFPPAGITLSCQCAGSSNLLPGAPLRSGFERENIAFAGPVIHFSRADALDPDLAVRRGKHISATFSDTVEQRVCACRAAA